MANIFALIAEPLELYSFFVVFSPIHDTCLFNLYFLLFYQRYSFKYCFFLFVIDIAKPKKKHRTAFNLRRVDINSIERLNSGLYCVYCCWRDLMRLLLLSIKFFFGNFPLLHLRLK